jgi:tRNA modification GTPase
VPRLLIRNKCDLSGTPPQKRRTERGTEISLSAVSGAGLDLLSAELRALAGWNTSGGDKQTAFTARARHVVALDAAGEHADRARHGLQRREPAETIAEELRLAQQQLGEITGVVSTEDLLGRIFSSFCIGK